MEWSIGDRGKPSRGSMSEHQIEIPVPRGSKILLFQLPSSTAGDHVKWFADAVRARTLDHWRDHPNEPAILVVTDDVTVRWLEVEAPEPAKAPRAPKRGTSTKSPMTTNCLAPERVRKG